jgi:hypothetical protein
MHVWTALTSRFPSIFDADILIREPAQALCAAAHDPPLAVAQTIAILSKHVRPLRLSQSTSERGKIWSSFEPTTCVVASPMPTPRMWDARYADGVRQRETNQLYSRPRSSSLRYGIEVGWDLFCHTDRLCACKGAHLKRPVRRTSSFPDACRRLSARCRSLMNSAGIRPARLFRCAASSISAWSQRSAAVAFSAPRTIPPPRPGGWG